MVTYVCKCHCQLCFSVDDRTLIADDKEADAFGPVAKDMKMKNLRSYLFTDILCIQVLASNKIFSSSYLVIVYRQH